MKTLDQAVKTVMNAANTQTCLTDDLRDAMRIVASKARYSDNDKDEILALKNLIMHCSIHSGYPQCGYRKMDSDERELFDAVISEMSDSDDD